jgi:hypothetical protein
MAAAVNLQDTSSEILDLGNCNLSVPECLHCVIWKEKLRTALEEIESLKLIIELLESDSEKCSPFVNSDVNSPSDVCITSGTVHTIESPTKWKTSKSKRRKKAPLLKTAEMKNTSLLAVANRYDHLTNLQITQEDCAHPEIQGQDESPVTHNTVYIQDLLEEDDTSEAHSHDDTSEIHDHPQPQLNEMTQQLSKNNKKPNNGYQGNYIPTILNGKIEIKNLGVSFDKVNYKYGKIKTQKTNQHKIKQHKVILVGDSFLRGIRDNVELSTSNKFDKYTSWWRFRYHSSISLQSI